VLMCSYAYTLEPCGLHASLDLIGARSDLHKLLLADIPQASAHKVANPVHDVLQRCTLLQLFCQAHASILARCNVRVERGTQCGCSHSAPELLLCAVRNLFLLVKLPLSPSAVSLMRDIKSARRPSSHESQAAMLAVFGQSFTVTWFEVFR
jgi:hypothetical protein